MKLFNSLSKTVQEIKPQADVLSMYSCGPTVYNNLHIGNILSFVYADLLRRAITSSNQTVKHTMNITDVDDKTIRDSAIDYPDDDPMAALTKLTKKYEQVFIDDMTKVGNDMKSIELIRATDSIKEMQKLILDLLKNEMAYIAEDGVYFSISAYIDSGKTYGQLVNINKQSLTNHRIANDEYDKDNISDFALWKKQAGTEPAWDFEVDGQDLTGRPGWHIECSAMSELTLGLPLDIHTGGIDLNFPHHENEIAQSTAGRDEDTYARSFFHNQHLLVDGTKMAKSKGNFYTLRDIEAKGFSALDLRMLALQSHYRHQLNFSWENLTAAQNRLNNLRNLAELRFQAHDGKPTSIDFDITYQKIAEAAQNDLNFPESLALLSQLDDKLKFGINKQELNAFVHFLTLLDQLSGLQLLKTEDVDEAAKELISLRQSARQAENWTETDRLRQELTKISLEIRDTPNGQLWSRL